MTINVRCMRSGTTVLAALVTAAAGLAAACAAHTGSDLAARAAAARSAGLGAGQVGTRAEVPWRSVGPGWALVEYAASTVPGVKPAGSGPTTLYLTDPAGGRYRLYQWPASKAPGPSPELVGWSGDKTRALITQPESRGPWLVEQITLATGKVAAFKLAPNVTILGYTKPDGLNILASVGLNQSKIARLNLRGQLQAVLARGQYLTAVQSPDGTTVAVSARTGLTLVSNAGGVIRRLPVPGGSCVPERWWNVRTILAGCFANGSAAIRLWLIPAEGGTATALTPQRTGHGADPYGDVGAWRLPSGLYLQALGACGTVFIARQALDGSVRPVTIPGTVGNNNRIVTAYGSRLLVQAETGCPGSDSLLWFDPASRAVQLLLRAPKDVIGVYNAVPYGRLGG